jgi:hypothetical protein
MNWTDVFVYAWPRDCWLPKFYGRLYPWPLICHVILRQPLCYVYLPNDATFTLVFQKIWQKVCGIIEEGSTSTTLNWYIAIIAIRLMLKNVALTYFFHFETNYAQVDNMSIYHSKLGHVAIVIVQQHIIIENPVYFINKNTRLIYQILILHSCRQQHISGIIHSLPNLGN